MTISRLELCAVQFCEEAESTSVPIPGVTYNPYKVQDTIEVGNDNSVPDCMMMRTFIWYVLQINIDEKAMMLLIIIYDAVIAWG